MSEQSITTVDPDRERKDKIIAIAKDVLKWVNTYRLAHGSYLEGSVPAVIDNDVDLQSCADTVVKYCEMCALGALLLSKARLYDDVPVRDIKYTYSSDDLGTNISTGNSYIKERLAGIFTSQQLNLIETAFECWSATDPAEQRAQRFGKQYRNLTERVIAVMNNIIANNGEFKPEA